MRKLWLLLTNTVTIAAGVILAVIAFAPQYARWAHKDVVTLREASSTGEHPVPLTRRNFYYHNHNGEIV